MVWRAALDALNETLRQVGYSVQSAALGDEAVARFGANPDFEVLVTDIVMPGEIQGPYFARKLREIKPELAVVFMSGYASESTVNGKGLRPQGHSPDATGAPHRLVAAIEKALSTTRAPVSLAPRENLEPSAGVASFA